MQELDYLVTADDIAYLNHYHAQRSPTLRRTRAIVGIALTIMGVAGFSLAMATTGAGIMFMAIMVVMGVWIAIGKRRGPSRQQREHIRRLFDEGRNRGLFGHHHIKLLENHIEVSTEFSRGEVNWEGVERVEEDEEYIFIYVSALNAYVINKKYFPSEESAHQFFLSADHLHRSALMLEGQHAARPALPYHGEPAREPPRELAAQPRALAPQPRRMLQGHPGLSSGAGGTGGGTDGTI